MPLLHALRFVMACNSWRDKGQYPCRFAGRSIRPSASKLVHSQGPAGAGRPDHAALYRLVRQQREQPPRWILVCHELNGLPLTSAGRTPSTHGSTAPKTKHACGRCRNKGPSARERRDQTTPCTRSLPNIHIASKKLFESRRWSVVEYCVMWA